MRSNRIARAALVTALTVAASHAQSALQDQGGKTTLDTDTNLLWLDMSETVGLSARSILDGTDPQNLVSAGWSLASKAQIETLLVHAGFLFGPPFSGSSSANQAQAAALVGFLGATGSNSGTDFIQAFSSEETSPGMLLTPTVLSSALAGGADFSVSVPDTVTNATIGSWMVQAVPEPETYALMLTGLGLVGWRLARARRASRSGRIDYRD